MTGRIQSLSMAYETLQKGTERLSEGIHTVEIDNMLNLFKSYCKLADKTSLQEGNLHTIQIITNFENISLTEQFNTLESYVQKDNQKLMI